MTRDLVLVSKMSGTSLSGRLRRRRRRSTSSSRRCVGGRRKPEVRSSSVASYRAPSVPRHEPRPCTCGRWRGRQSAAVICTAPRKSLARAQLHQHSFRHSLRGRCCRRCGSLAPPPLPRPCTAMPRGRSSSTGYNMPDRHSFDAWLFICTCRPLSSAVGTCGARSSLQDISSRALCLATRDLVEP